MSDLTCKQLGLCQARVVRCDDCPDTTKRFARTEGEAFKTPEWATPIEMPEDTPVTWWEVLVWALVVTLAFVAIGLQAGVQS